MMKNYNMEDLYSIGGEKIGHVKSVTYWFI